MSFPNEKLINNLNDTSFQRIITCGVLPKAFILMLFQMFLPSSDIGKILFDKIGKYTNTDKADDYLVDKTIYEVDLAEYEVVESPDSVKIPVTLYEEKYLSSGDIEDIKYIEYHGCLYRIRDVNIDKISSNKEFIDFLLSYKDADIGTEEFFTTSFLQKLV